MPNAAVERDGTFSLGYSFDNPYGTAWATATLLPFLQVTGRYVSINGISGFTDTSGVGYGANYGRFKDKVADVKVRLWEEQRWLPSVAIGATDLLGTELFKGKYAVATKTFGSARSLEASVGVGDRRPDGPFAALRYTPPAAPDWSFVAEYDATDYSRDLRATETAAGQRRKGPVVAAEYRYGWLGAQLARHRDHFSANVYVSVPLWQRDFVPKIAEPAFYQQKDAPPRAALSVWENSGRPAGLLALALGDQDFKNIRVSFENRVLKISLTNNRISNLGRAIGRASRTALAFAPAGTRALHITYTRNEQPVVTYEMQDLYALSYYLGGTIDRAAFLRTMQVRAATPYDQLPDLESLADGAREAAPIAVDLGRDGNAVQLRSEDRESNRLRLAPKLGLFFNDPSGALRYEVAAAANYDRRLGPGFYLNGAVSAKLFETISGVTQESNSLLPHVRTDIAEYKRGSRFKLNKLMLNKYYMPTEHWYTRFSGGLYEEMFRGAGGQAMYAGNDSRWAADLTVDALQQRGYKGLLDARDYKTVTALLALHYRLPSDITVTARAGRFLAKDSGVRLEFKRRFASGIEIGAWYSKTNGNDITSPGTPTSPYNDKGVYLNLALRPMLTSDTQANASLAISPWTRDVAQMVASPGDLYDMIESPRRDMGIADGLGNFGERPDEQAIAASFLDPRPLRAPWPAFRMRLEQAADNSPTLPEWVKGGALAAGATLVSAALDKPVDRFVQHHESGEAVRVLGNFGKIAPIAMAGFAGAAVAFGDERQQNIGLIAMQAIAGAVAVTEVGKYAVGRARPGENLGPWSQVQAGTRGNASFPSGHSAVAFAAITPFAQEYQLPWLYSLAALSASGRVAARQHWTSDVLAGSLVGYVIGNELWRAQRTNRGTGWSVMPAANSLHVSYSGQY